MIVNFNQFSGMELSLYKTNQPNQFQLSSCKFEFKAGKIFCLEVSTPTNAKDFICFIKIVKAIAGYDFVDVRTSRVVISLGIVGGRQYFTNHLKDGTKVHRYEDIEVC